MHHARNVLRSLEKMQGDLSEYTSGVRGHIRIFANVSSIVETLPDELGAFLRRHDGVKVDLEDHTSAQVVRGVADGRSGGAAPLSIEPDEFEQLRVELDPDAWERHRRGENVTGELVLRVRTPQGAVARLAYSVKIT